MKQPIHVAQRRTDGFSLLELVVVLAILALIAGTGLSIANNALQSADRIATREKLATIQLALDSHAKTYGYLPCPADATLLVANPNFGMENRSSGTCPLAAPGIVGVTGNSVTIGALPVRTLGLPDNYAGDAWGNKLTYAVSTAAASNPTSYSTQPGAITIRYGDRTTWYSLTQQRQSYAYSSVSNNGGKVRLNGATAPGVGIGMLIHLNGTGTTKYKGSYATSAVGATSIDLNGLTYVGDDSGTAQWQQNGAGASYVVVSHGADGRGAYPINSATIPAAKLCLGVGANTSPPPCTSAATTSCIDIENCKRSDNVFYDTVSNDGPTPATYFDDFIVWGSNASQQLAVNPIVYDGCPITSPPTCELWCAKCSFNYPGDNTAILVPAPPTGMLNPVLCKKTINSSATDCKAACFWSGSIPGGYIKCP